MNEHDQLRDAAIEIERLQVEIERLQALELKVHRLVAALGAIAQYDPRWRSVRPNNAPSREQLIERAYDVWSEQR